MITEKSNIVESLDWLPILIERQMTQISVVIPSYNSEDYLRSTLDGIASQEFSGNFEVVLVDCSDTDKVQAIGNSYEFVKFEHVTERFTPGMGRNIGAKIARGCLLAFVDADVVLMPNTLESAWQFYSSGNRVFGGALELNERAKSTVASYFEHFYYNHENQRGMPVSIRNNLSSALMFVEKDLFLEQQGFKDIPRVQDTEFSERLVSNGFQLGFNPEAVGLQIQDSPMCKVFRKIHISGRNLYYIRYRSLAVGGKIALFTFLPILTVLKVFRIEIRHLVYQNTRNRIIALLLFPFFTLAGFYWMTGLYRSMIFGGGISSKRD